MTIHTPNFLSMNNLSDFPYFHQIKDTLACQAAFQNCTDGRVSCIVEKTNHPANCKEGKVETVRDVNQLFGFAIMDL